MAVIDIEPLLTPISDTEPSGVWLKFDSIYDQIKEARREDEHIGDQGVWETKQKKADWPTVRRLCSDALKKQTKDLWIAVWLLESWTATDYYDGLISGLNLLNRLCVEFWDTMYPEIEDGDVEYRVSPIAWLGEKHVYKIKFLPLTSPRSGGVSLTILDREIALEFDKTQQKKPAILDEINMSVQMTLEKFNLSERDTPDNYYLELKDKITCIIGMIDALEQELNARCGNDAPSMRAFKKPLEDALQFVKSTLKRRGLIIEDIGSTVIRPMDKGSKIMIDPPTRPEDGIVQSRDAAYKQIQTATEYLKKAEPHSPVPYLIERALKWGSMSLPQLLGELVADESNRSTILGLLGIVSEQNSSDNE